MMVNRRLDGHVLRNWAYENSKTILDQKEPQYASSVQGIPDVVLVRTEVELFNSRPWLKLQLGLVCDVPPVDGH